MKHEKSNLPLQLCKVDDNLNIADVVFGDITWDRLQTPPDQATAVGQCQAELY